MDWDKLKDALDCIDQGSPARRERGLDALYGHFSRIDLARLALAGKALAEAARVLMASDTGAELRGDPADVEISLAAWDKAEREER